MTHTPETLAALLACPFCGGRDVTVLPNEQDHAHVHCNDCMAKGPVVDQVGDWTRPTQKPVALMQWCLGFLPNAQTILDPFMGSGTTLVACERMGRKGIGIELDLGYFDIACRRVEEAVRQPRLNLEPEPKQVQARLEI
jgi:DNA modification methylase